MNYLFVSRYAQNQQQSQVGKALLDFVLRKYCGLDPDALTLCRTERGKPYFAGNPVFFNFSHSGGRVVLAVSDAPVGVDTEPMRTVRPEVARRFLGQVSDDPVARLRAWLCRESYGKMTGEGFFHAFPPRPHFFTEYHLTDPGGEYFITLCTPAPIRRPEVIFAQYTKTGIKICKM